LGTGDWGLVAGVWLLGTGRSRRVRAPIRVFRAPSPQPPAPRENPIARKLRHAICGAFGEGERDRTGLTADAVVVDIEAAAQTEARVEDERADECAGAVPCVMQDRRERRHVRSQSRRAVGVNAVRRSHASTSELSTTEDTEDTKVSFPLALAVSLPQTLSSRDQLLYVSDVSRVALRRFVDEALEIRLRVGAPAAVPQRDPDVVQRVVQRRIE